MANKFFCLICFCLLTLANQVTGQTFQRTYGSTAGDIGRQIVSTYDNSFVAVGLYGATEGVYLIKVDSLGNTIWQKTFNPPNMLSFHNDYSIKQTPDSGFIMAGSIYYTMGNAIHICLIKTNSAGDTLWTKQYGGPNLGYYKGVAYDVIITSDGGYAVAGTEIGSSSKNVFLLKTDNNGNVQWAKYYGGTSDDEGYSLKQTSDSGYIIAGYTYSFGQGGWDVYLLKVGATGSLQWTKTYGGNRYDFANHIEITNDGGFILTGETSGNGTGTIYDNDLFLMKTDSAGNSDWSYTYGGNSGEGGTSVKQTSDNGFIATGCTYSSGAGQSDVYLLKTDSAGSVLWSSTFGGASPEQGNDVIQHGTNYFVIGRTRNFSKGFEDVYLIKTDSIGTGTCKQDTAITIQTVLPWVQGTGGTENSGYTIQSDIIVVGTADTASYNPCVCVPPIANFQIGMTHTCGSFYNYSTWANTWYWDFGNGDTSTVENPNYCWWANGVYYVCLSVTNDCGTDTHCDSVSAFTGINELKKNRIKLFISPNPFDNFTVVKFENAKREKIKLQILNPIGQSVLQIDNITDNKVQIEKNGLPSGLYFVRLIKDNQVIGADKIVIE
ncbi:MAG: T9SS type A sorting domain-containing protein [Chitinophagaceae bacterium]|nr:T9SS type A sorting domain-containing protein [Chitinophagaceae bacterium]